jgi:hypothetical protein
VASFVSFESENDETLPNFNNNKESSQERERKRNKGGQRSEFRQANSPKMAFWVGHKEVMEPLRPSPAVLSM